MGIYHINICYGGKNMENYEMDIDTKLKFIRGLSELNGKVIALKLAGEDYSEILEDCKKAAKVLMNNGVGEFDFSSNEAFEESMTNFFKEALEEN